VGTPKGLVLGIGLFLTGTSLATLGLPAPDPDEQAVAPAIALRAEEEPAAEPTPQPEIEPQIEPEIEPAVERQTPRRKATIVMGGDLLWHNTVWESAASDAPPGRRYDFNPMFAALRPLIHNADVAICHEEVPFAGPGEPLQSYPVFAAPPQVAPWIASMGWDACTTASNHAVDQGFEGLKETADLLDANGVEHVGTFRSPRERRQPVIVTTDDGVRVGIVAGTFSLNGFPLPEGRPWSVSMWDAADLLGQAERAREAGADIVVVHIHGGTEYDHLPNADQVDLVRRLTASPDVDIVLGDHAHVVQPITRVNGKWVVYGMGNMVAQQDPSQPRTYEGISVSFTFAERPRTRRGWVVTEAAYVPTYWNTYAGGHPIRIQRVVKALARGRGDLARLREARAEIREAVGGLGWPSGLVER
jgi:hypothetical protein